MNWLHQLARRLRMLVHRRQFDADIDEEMRLHLEMASRRPAGTFTGCSCVSADGLLRSMKTGWQTPLYSPCWAPQEKLGFCLTE